MIVLSFGHCLFFVLILSVCFDVDALNKLWISSAWVLLVWLSSKRSNQTPPQPFWQRSTLKPRRSTSLSFDSQAGQCIVGSGLDSLISLWQASCHMSVFCFLFTLSADSHCWRSQCDSSLLWIIFCNNQSDLPCDSFPIYHSRCLNALVSIRLQSPLG